MTVVDELARCRALRDLSPAHLARLASISREVRYHAGRRLFEEGASAWGCWVITSGRVAVETHIPGRGRVTIETLHPGDLLGWSWLTPPNRWHFSAVAVTDTSAVRIDTDRYLGLAAADDAFGHAVVKAVFGVLLDRLQATRGRMLDLYRSSRRRTEGNDRDDAATIPGGLPE